MIVLWHSLIKGIKFGVRRPEFKSWLFHLLSGTMSLSFLISIEHMVKKDKTCNVQLLNIELNPTTVYCFNTCTASFLLQLVFGLCLYLRVFFPSHIIDRSTQTGSDQPNKQKKWKEEGDLLAIVDLATEEQKKMWSPWIDLTSSMAELRCSKTCCRKLSFSISWLGSSWIRCALSGVPSGFMLVCVCVLVTQSYPTLCDPIDCSLPGSSVSGILQAITVEWVAISFSRGSSQPWHQTQVCHIAGRSFTVWATTEAFMLIVSQFQEELLLL